MFQWSSCVARVFPSLEQLQSIMDGIMEIGPYLMDFIIYHLPYANLCFGEHPF